ncbi:M48 family metalloprotease [Nocardia sp. NPDC058176]|uniref:M48 family metalloprotease n=1 Tax=Nocardia sp. NPDC058176 TaxID=3346368 RepID=UPI0036D8464D
MPGDEPLLAARQRIAWHAVLIVASAPSIVLSGSLLVGPVSRWWSPWAGVVVAVIWVGSGPIVLYRSRRAERRYASSSAAVGAATMPVATARVRTAWKYVALGAGVPRSTCTIRVVEGKTFSASHFSDRHIEISRHTVNVLTARQLEAIVAHEFGHHLQRSAVLRELLTWYRRLFDTMGIMAYRPSVRLVRALNATSRPGEEALLFVGGIVAWLGAGSAILVGLWLLLGPWAVLLALAGIPWQGVLVQRRAWWCEFHADRVAVDLGYARYLREALTIAETECVGTGDFVPAWLQSHPGNERRFAAMDSAQRRWTAPGS